ncbi:MAG: hypothetical protein AB2L20_30155 [Mangrovibacterium sp.]
MEDTKKGQLGKLTGENMSMGIVTEDKDTKNLPDSNTIKRRTINKLASYTLIYNFKTGEYSICTTFNFFFGDRPEGIVMLRGTLQDCEMFVWRNKGKLS